MKSKTIAITMRIDKSHKDKIITVSKSFGLDSSSFCRFVVLQKIAEIEHDLKIKQEQLNGESTNF